jgi:hypothetical protein
LSYPLGAGRGLDQKAHTSASNPGWVGRVLDCTPALPPEAQARIGAGQPLVVLRSGEIIDGRLSDIGGTRPLRLTIDTPSGQRDFTSNDVAQIYLYAPVLVAV